MNISNTAGMKAYLQEQYNNGTPVCVSPQYYEEKKLHYTLTPTEVTTLNGANNIWADCGDVDVTYRADTQMYINNRDKAITQSIAPIENGTTASNAYSQGDYFFHNTKFCKALTAIASGATFTLNTNYAETTVAEELATILNV